jgi:LPXTG-motif cell wall-anchored protein
MLGQHAMWAFTDEAEFEELKKYGADSLSIAKTKEILNNLNLETKLTPKLVAAKNEETNEMTLNRNYVFTGAGLLCILATTTIILLFRRKKKDDTIA